AACSVVPCAGLRADKPAACTPAPAVKTGSAGPRPGSAPSTPSTPSPDAGPCAAGTCSVDDAPATDPAWLPPVPELGPAVPRSLRLEPTPQSNRRTGDCAPTSRHPDGPSSPDRRPSPEPALAPPLRTPPPVASTASTVRSQSDRLHSRPATAPPDQASSPTCGSILPGWLSFPGCVPRRPARLPRLQSSRHGHPIPKIVPSLS